MTIRDRRWQKFVKNRIAMLSVGFLILISFLSFTAEFWANSKPIVLYYKGSLYFPVVRTYHPSVFGIENEFITNYRELPKAQGDWALWPLVTWDPLESNKNLERYPAPPTKENWMGTDDRGRDVFTRLLYGFRYTLAYAFGVWLMTYLIGTVSGAIAGYFGGRVDIMGARFIELLDMVPQLLLLITLIAIFSPSIWLLVVFTSLFDWTGIYQQMRAQFLQLRKREFVEAARALGFSHIRIMWRHILPNALTPLITFSPFAVAANVQSLAVLDYLGLGLRPPTPSWGELIAQSQRYFSTAEWLVWFPAGALVLTMIALLNVGIAVRDAFDARA